MMVDLENGEVGLIQNWIFWNWNKKVGFGV